MLMAMFEISVANVLVKIGVFLLVQALVYLILSNSSNIFSKNKMMRSLSLRPSRSCSIRRIMGFISDIPLDADESSRGIYSPSIFRGSEIPSSKAD